MNYYFVFLLQAMLPLAILCGCHFHHSQKKMNLKLLLWISFLGLCLGVLLAFHYPKGQQAILILNTAFLTSLILFYLTQFFTSTKSGHFFQFFQFILCTIASYRWAKDPNISAITNTDVINTDFILHLSAVAFAFIFCVFIAIWLYILLNQTQNHQRTTIFRLILTTLMILILIMPLIGELLLNLMKLQLLALTKERLGFVAKSINLSSYFNFISGLILFLCINFFIIKVHHTRKRAVYFEQDPIEKRKKIAFMRNSNRTIIWGLIAVLTIIGSQLYWNNIASKPPQLSEAITVTLDQNNNIRIPIEQVKDGKLHRFVWTASDGKAVRFFIINKSNKTLNFAAVFDACILCGDQGYVMEGEQVICIGCGVRMFIPSIGKAGGCNPVPIENWQQTESEIVIHRKNLEAGLNYFSTIVELNVIDPIDGTKLKNTTAEFKYNYDHTTYFFASEKNLNLFRDNPEKYLPQMEKK
ncbi:Fe-S-containing protein [Seminibacterium arietis]|uniref:Fe-S-containing protein n=1 Tax=Seminibacterium arietis TaxID=1173502 RepID=A0ABW3I8M1_9PAST